MLRNAVAVLAIGWVVYDEGSAEVGCGGGTIPAVPPAVRTDLGLECPGS